MKGAEAMKRLGWCALVMSALILAGCGQKKAEAAESLYEQVTGIPANQVLLTVDGRDVPAWRYFYWLTYNCDYLTEACDAEGQALDWEADRSGQTMAQYVKQQALDTTVLYAVIENWAEEYGCDTDDRDQEALEQEWEALCEKYGSESRCLGELAWMGLDRAGADAFTLDYHRYSRLRELAVTPGSTLYPAEDALGAFAQSAGYRTVDSILISTADVQEGDTAAMAEKRERAEMVLSKLEGSSDPMEYFSTLAGMYSDAPREETPQGITFVPGDGRVSEAVERASEDLEENQWSGIVEVPDGLAILLRRPLDKAAVAADWFDSRLQQAAQKAEVKPAPEYEDINPADFYEKLIAARGQLDRSGETAGVFGPSSSETLGT